MNLFKSFLHVITRYFSFVKQNALSFSKVFTFTSKGISLTNAISSHRRRYIKKIFLKSLQIHRKTTVLSLFCECCLEEYLGPR